MSKNEFMESLAVALGGVEASQREEILSDFREHFEAGLSEYKTEEDICARLGDPVQIARQFTVECRIEKAEEEPGAKNILRAVFASAGLGFFNLVFVLGPFIGLCAVLLSMYAAVFAMGLAGVITILVVIISPALGDLVYLGEGLDWLTAMFFSAGCISLSILLISPLARLTKWFYGLIIKYLKFNADIITGRRNRA